MSHPGDKAPLSQPLTVEIGDANNGRTESNNNLFPDGTSSCNNNDDEDAESLGPLPPKWEKAYTESGEAYFIDHSTGTSHWLDPRLSKFQKKSLEDCLDDELPYGWEKISDPHYGTYFIDHVNRRTQYENPVIQAKRAQSMHRADSRASFTKNPAELCGQKYRTSLVKSSRGLGFTIVGGDDHDGVDEFLQIKSVVPKGPAWLDGQLCTGDVIVRVNDICVLGYTHNRIVRLFQSIPVGSTVALEVCRGYPLPFDPNDPNTEVVTTIAVDAHLLSPNTAHPSLPMPPGPPGSAPGAKRLQTPSSAGGATLVDTNYNYLDGVRRQPHHQHHHHNNHHNHHHHHLQQHQEEDGDDGGGGGEGGGGSEGDVVLDDDVLGSPQSGSTTGVVGGDRSDSLLGKSLHHHQLTLTTPLTSPAASTASSTLLLPPPPPTTQTTSQPTNTSPTTTPTPTIDVRVSIVKGNLGFGFTIADSACGQRVKKILDRQRCKNLQEGDILLAINECSLLRMCHDDVVQVLKSCAYNSEATICVQRGSGGTKSLLGRNKPRKLSEGRTTVGQISQSSIMNNSLYRSKTPTADIYSTQPREVLPSRPKTPIIDTRHIHSTSSKPPPGAKDMNCNGVGIIGSRSNLYADRAQLRLSLIDNGDVDVDVDVDLDDDVDTIDQDIDLHSDHHHLHQQNASQAAMAAARHKYHRYDCQCYLCCPPPQSSGASVNSVGGGLNGVGVGGSMYDALPPHHLPSNGGGHHLLKMNNGMGAGVNAPWWPPGAGAGGMMGAAYQDMNIVLHRQESGFGFRIVGGIEDRSQVAVGHIVPSGAADLDARIRTADEILSVDGYSVIKASHRQVVQLMNAAATRGQVSLILRRRGINNNNNSSSSNHHQQLQQQQQPVHLSPYGGGVVDGGIAGAEQHMGGGGGGQHILVGEARGGSGGGSYDVTVARSEHEGFGFVIISSVNKIGSTIGRLIEDSPAERCGRLRVGDYIVAVNHIDIMHLTHGDIVNLIKESGLSVTLTIAPTTD